MLKSKLKKLPRFKSIDKLVEFFDRYDWGDYLEHMPNVEIEVDIKRKIQLITLESDVADKITEIAKSKHTSSESLINKWVLEKIMEYE